MLLPLLFLFFLIFTNKNNMALYFTKKNLDRLTLNKNSLSPLSRNILFFIISILFIISLARPVSVDNNYINYTNPPSLIVAFHSKYKPSYIKPILDKILETNISIAIIVYDKYSYIISPLTNDYISLKHIIKNLKYETTNKDQTYISTLLKTTLLLTKEYKNKNLLIIDDDISFNKDQQKYITKHNIVLKNIDDIKYIKDESNHIEIYHELYFYPLFLAIVLLIFAFSSLPRFKNSKNSLVMILFLSYFTQNKIYANIFQFDTIKEANKFYNNGEFKKASEKYRELKPSAQSYYNFANSLYKEGKYRSAIKIYFKVLTTKKEKTLEAKKLYNIANCYVKLNDLQKAKEFYNKSLKLHYDKDTKENLDLVNYFLKHKKNKDLKPQNKTFTKGYFSQKQKDKKKSIFQDNKKIYLLKVDF